MPGTVKKSFVFTSVHYNYNKIMHLFKNFQINKLDLWFENPDELLVGLTLSSKASSHYRRFANVPMGRDGHLLNIVCNSSVLHYSVRKKISQNNYNFG